MRLIEAVIKPKIVFITHYIHCSQVRNAVYECVWRDAGNSLTHSLIMSATSKV